MQHRREFLHSFPGLLTVVILTLGWLPGPSRAETFEFRSGDEGILARNGCHPGPMSSPRIIVPHDAWDPLGEASYLHPDDSETLDGCGVFQVEFELPEGFTQPSIQFSFHADNSATVALNGFLIGQGDDFTNPPESVTTSQAKFFQPGRNTATVTLRNTGGPFGVAFIITVSHEVMDPELDSDEDGLPDWWELRLGLEPENPSDALLDVDEDGLDYAEEFLLGTDPDRPDSDDDGLKDGQEVSAGTDPLDPDSDDDGFTDGKELSSRSDPLDPDSLPPQVELEFASGRSPFEFGRCAPREGERRPAEVFPTDQAWDTLPDSRWIRTGADDPHVACAVFYSTFDLPDLFIEPELQLEILVDDEVDVFLNGNPLGSFTGFLLPAHQTGTRNRTDFQPGPNEISFVTRSGGGADGLNVTGRVTYSVLDLFLRGNANDDEKVDLSDAICILRNLFLGGCTLRCLDAADANDDGVVDLSDPVRILNFLFVSSENLPFPGPVRCGADLTPDSLTPVCISAKCPG